MKYPMRMVFAFFMMIACLMHQSVALFEQRITTESPTDDSQVTLGWSKFEEEMAFNLLYETQDLLDDSQELRLCFESIKIDENFNRNIKSVVFYGDVKDKKFTHVGIPNTEFPADSHEFWLCSRPRDSSYIDLIGFDNPEFDVFLPNKINKTTDSAIIQFLMPMSNFELGNNLVQIAWGVFPSKQSSDMDLVRGTGQPLTFYNSFEFIDLYDNTLSFWLGVSILAFSQFWGIGFPFATTLVFIMSLYDFSKLIESIYYLANITEGHPQENEFTLGNLIAYPIRRYFLSTFLLTPMIFLSLFQFFAVILSVITTFFNSWFSLIGINALYSQQWWVMIAITYVIIPILIFVIDAAIFAAFSANINL